MPHWLTVIAALGVLLAAAYMLWMVMRVVLGAPSRIVSGLPDATAREIGIVTPLVGLSVLVGVWWGGLLGYVDPAVRVLLRLMRGAA